MTASDMSRLPAAFRRLAWSNLAAQSAEQVGLAAAPIVAVLSLGAGPGEAGMLQTVQTLPFLLFAIPIGVLADRVSRRRLMAVAEAVRALSLAGVLALAISGLLTWPLLALLGFVGACGTVAYMIAAPALVPSLVPPTMLARANARIELARTVAFAGGPALAGALVGWIGGGPAFGVAAALSFAAVGLLAGIHEPAQPPRQRRRPLVELREGAGFVLGHRLLLPVLVTQTVFNAAFFMLQAVYVPYAVHQLGLGATAVGATLATYGIGMVAGALVAPRLLAGLPFGIVVALGPVAGLAASLVMLATVWVSSVYLAGFSFLLIGAGPILWVISTTTLRQSVTPRDLLGRVSAINIVTYGARPVGAAMGALVGGLYGAETCLAVAALGFLVQALVILASPVVQLVRQPEVVS
jgi:predicted MFS family arabinose efflux permease